MPMTDTENLVVDALALIRDAEDCIKRDNLRGAAVKAGVASEMLLLVVRMKNELPPVKGNA
jgi:hypothetical protein